VQRGPRSCPPTQRQQQEPAGLHDRAPSLQRQPLQLARWRAARLAPRAARQPRIGSMATRSLRRLRQPCRRSLGVACRKFASRGRADALQKRVNLSTRELRHNTNGVRHRKASQPHSDSLTHTRTWSHNRLAPTQENTCLHSDSRGHMATLDHGSGHDESMTWRCYIDKSKCDAHLTSNAHDKQTSLKAEGSDLGNSIKTRVAFGVKDVTKKDTLAQRDPSRALLSERPRRR